MEEAAEEEEVDKATGKRVVVQLGTKVNDAACSSINEGGSPSAELTEAIFGRYTFCFESPRTVVTSEQLLLLSV